ncbi:hypothetical protein Tco_0663905 [Tanacetum coccineum]
MHNNIMVAGLRDHPPMLATRRYAQKCILQGPYTLSTVTIPGQPAIDNSPAVEAQTILETLSNISPKNKAHYDAEKEEIHLLLTGIGYEIYLTVDACKTTHEMWIAIERLQQGESLNKQDVKTSLFWEFGKFTSRDGESIESYYFRFYKMMNEMKIVDLDKESYHKLFDILKQYQNDLNEICAETIAKNANPLALVVAAQQYLDPYYQAPKSHKSYAPPSKQSSSTRSHAPTRYKGKEIAKPITPLSESASKEDGDPEQAQRDMDMQKNLVAKYFKKIYKPTNNNLRTSSNTRNKTIDTSPRYKNDNQTGQFRNQRIMIVTGARETVGSQVHTDDDYTVFANERQHFEQLVSIINTHLVEKVDSNVILDHWNLYDNDNQADQNAKEYDDECVVLANFIENLKLDNDENKKIQSN